MPHRYTLKILGALTVLNVEGYVLAPPLQTAVSTPRACATADLQHARTFITMNYEDPDATRDAEEKFDDESMEANRISLEGVMRIRERARMRTNGVAQKVWAESTVRKAGQDQTHVPRPPTPEQAEAANALFESMLRGKSSELPRSIKRGMGRWDEDNEEDGFGEGLERYIDDDSDDDEFLGDRGRVLV